MVKIVLLIVAIVLLMSSTFSFHIMKEEYFGWTCENMSNRICFFLWTLLGTITNALSAWYIIHFFLNDFGY